MTQLLDLRRYFAALGDEPHLIVKMSAEFPAYHIGADVDVFCADLQAAARRLLAVGNEDVKQGWRIVVTSHEAGGTHLDLFAPGEERLCFRFDLHGGLPAFTRVHLSPAFFWATLERRISVERAGQCYFVPDKLDDLVLRYAEYLEYYEQRPDKIRHLEFILQAVESDAESRQFLERLHLYTKPRLMEVPPDTHFAQNALEEYAKEYERLAVRVGDLTGRVGEVEARCTEILHLLRHSQRYRVGDLMLRPLDLARKAARKLRG